MLCCAWWYSSAWWASPLLHERHPEANICKFCMWFLISKQIALSSLWNRNVFLWGWFLYTYSVFRLGIYVYVHTRVVIRKENSPRESARSYWRPLSFKNLYLPSLSKASAQCGSWIIHWNIRFLFVCIHLSLALLLSSPPYSLAYFATVLLFSVLLIRLWKRSIRKKLYYCFHFFSRIYLTSWRTVISWPWRSEAIDNEPCWSKPLSWESWGQTLHHASTRVVAEGPCWPP